MEAGAVTTPRLSSMILLALLRRPIRSYSLCLARHRRHTAAVHLLEAGVEINIIRAWLGHVSLDTTHRYAEITVQMKAQALEACEPGRICALSFRPV